VMGDSFWTSSPRSSSRIAEVFIHSVKRVNGKTGGSLFGILTWVRRGAKGDGLFAKEIGGGTGRGSSVICI